MNAAIDKPLTQTALAQALGLSKAAITKLKQQGMPVHSVAAARAWRKVSQNVALQKPDAGAPPPTVPPAPPEQRAQHPPVSDVAESFHEARARKESRSADMIELDLAKKRGALIEVDEVRSAYARRAAGLREALMQIPARLAAVLAAETDVGKCHDTLRDELHQVLQQVTQG